MKRFVYSIAYLFRVGINHNRFSQLISSACHFTKDKGSCIISAGGNIFFGNQVHSIAQRSYKRNVTGAVQGNKLGKGERAILVMNGSPLKVSIPAVNTAYQLINL